MTLEAVEKKIGHIFNDKTLLRLALTHPSFGQPNNQRLEFLGDAVLQLSVSDMLYHSMPDSDEGIMTRRRALLVQGRALRAAAVKLGIGEALFLGRSERMSGGEERESNLADAVEAVIGAVYLDAGFQEAKAAVRRVMDCINRDDWMDYKTRLQELTQGNGQGLPEYETESEDGPPHARVFTVRVALDGGVIAHGSGKSKKAAEQDAAKRALAAYGEE